MSMHMSAHMSMQTSIHVRMHESIHMPVHMFIYMPIHMSTSIPTHMSSSSMPVGCSLRPRSSPRCWSSMDYMRIDMRTDHAYRHVLAMCRSTVQNLCDDVGS